VQGGHQLVAPSLQVVGPPREFIWLFLGVLVLIAVLSYLAALSARRNHSPPDRYWKGGVFYVNCDDPALFVDKRFGIGYTLNFGNPWSWAVLVLIVLVIAAPVILAALSVRTLIQRMPRPRT
jgi:uncharacterized membrane protein